MTTTRSQSQAMSNPQPTVAAQEPESPSSTPSQESSGSTPSKASPESTSSQNSPLSPGWVHAISIIMSYSLKSEISQQLQKWVLYHEIDDPTNFWLSWDPTDSEDIRLLQKYTERNGSVVYLPSSTVKNLISLWDYMNTLIKQNRTADQKYDKFCYVIDDQWLKLTAHDMRSALVDMKLEKQSTYTTHTSTSHSSPGPMRSPMNMELASFKKSIKREASAYSLLKDECFFDKFQRDLFITAKSHDVSEILDPTFTPGPSPEERELFETKRVFMY